MVIIERLFSAVVNLIIKMRVRYDPVICSCKYTEYEYDDSGKPVPNVKLHMKFYTDKAYFIRDEIEIYAFDLSPDQANRLVSILKTNEIYKETYYTPALYWASNYKMRSSATVYFYNRRGKGIIRVGGKDCCQSSIMYLFEYVSSICASN